MSELGFKQYLLCGYDMIKNPFGDPEGIKRVPILDLDKLNGYESSLGWATEVSGNRRFQHKSYVSENEYELSSSVGAGLNAGVTGGSFGFSANVKTSYSQAYTQGTVFGKTVSSCKIQQYANTLSKEQLSKYVFPDVLTDMKTMEAKDFFEMYGTHLILSFSIGGQFTIEFRTKETTAKTSAEIESDVEASYRFITAGASGDYSQAAKDFNKECEYEIYGVGGELNFLPKEINENSNCVSWFSSVEEKPALYEIEESIPIWELAPTAAAQNELVKGYLRYYNAYLEAKRKALPFIKELKVVTRSDSHVDSQKSIEEMVTKFDVNYECDNADLNKGAKGDFIYLLYKHGGITDQKVTDILINCTDVWADEPVKDGYVHIPVDLNKNAKGKYIFIDYKLEDSSTEGGYQALGVRTTTTPVSDDWVLITDKKGNPVDLNKGAGGAYLYLFGYIDPISKEIEMQIKKNGSMINDKD